MRVIIISTYHNQYLIYKSSCLPSDNSISKKTEKLESNYEWSSFDRLTMSPICSNKSLEFNIIIINISQIIIISIFYWPSASARTATFADSEVIQ